MEPELEQIVEQVEELEAFAVWYADLSEPDRRNFTSLMTLKNRQKLLDACPDPVYKKMGYLFIKFETKIAQSNEGK